MRLTAVFLSALLLVCSCRGGRQAQMSVESPKELACAKDFHPGDTIQMEDLARIGADSFFVCRAIDSTTFSRMDGLSYKETCPIKVEDLRYLQVLHKNIEGDTIVGEMVVNRAIAADVLDILHALYNESYPIQRMLLVDEYGADDNASMAANNSSAFNCRDKDFKQLSRHAYGLAVDINPLYNPHVKGDKVIPEYSREYANRNAVFPYKITKGDRCQTLFREHGFRWGGSWLSSKDWQHFEK